MKDCNSPYVVDKMNIRRLFSRKDYEGLTGAQQAHLRDKRNHAAKMLREERKDITRLIDKD